MDKQNLIKIIINSFLITILGFLTILFGVLYIDLFGYGFFYKFKTPIIFLLTALVTVFTILSVIFSLFNKDFIYKLTVIILGFAFFAFLVLYILKFFDILDKIDSVEDLRAYVQSFGALATVIYIILNFLQVVVLPIPGLISIGAGVALFGPLKTSIYAYIGITLGSFVAYFIGRVLGYKVVSWLVGKDALDKWLKSVKNKDKFLLTFMFVFPFFPDDILCFVAGLSSMSNGYFTVMILITRAISTIGGAYSLNGSIIPFNTWWGIVVWGIIIVFTVIFTIIIYKKGDKLEGFFKKKFLKK